MVSIKSIGRKNPQDVNLPEKFYAQAIANGRVDLERLAYLASNQSTVRESDCYAVLLALEHNIMDELRSGRIVELGKVGRFQVGVRSHGNELPDEVNSSSIKSAHLNFRPGRRFRDMLRTLDYKLVNG
ncbi:MAG TPA: HU family DNA-binding protein [Flavobacteriaceae bacterium]|nr:HU family DNA-binding protein [Flavobacteriaceae bacterium]